MPLHTTLKLEANEEYLRCHLSNDNPSSSQYDVQWRSFQSLTKRHFEWSSTSLGLPRKLGLQFEIPSTCTYFTGVVWGNLILLRSFLVHLEGMLCNILVLCGSWVLEGTSGYGSKKIKGPGLVWHRFFLIFFIKVRFSFSFSMWRLILIPAFGLFQNRLVPSSRIG
jgi:hypothetical protein